MRGPFGRTVRGIRNSLAALGLLFTLVTVTPLIGWWARALAGDGNASRGDVLIVLGGSILDDGTIGISSYRRSVHAARIFREGGFKQVIITGGGELATPIAAPMRDFLVSLGVPGKAIAVETGAASTRENAVFTSRMMSSSAGRKVLATSDYHMFRAWRAFRKAGLDVAPRPVPDLIEAADCWSCRWQGFLTLATESAKIVYYYARGWI
jgi:uncharacterized SAM-binding protein YcdF (DUF218 family)